LEQASKQSYNKLQHNNSQESRLERRGHRGEQKWQQQRALSKISQLLLEMYKCFHNSLFSQQQTKPNQTKPNQKRPQFQIPKMNAKDVIHTHTHTLTSVFFLGQLFLVLFLFLLTKEKLGKLWNYFFFVFLTVNLSNFAPFFFLGNFVKF